MSIELIKSTLTEARDALDQLIANDATLLHIEQAAQLLITSFKARGRAFSSGNGGSMCDAMHFAEELTGRFRSNRPGLAATAISDASHMSCVAKRQPPRAHLA